MVVNSDFFFYSCFCLVWVYADAALDWQRVAVGLCAESEGFHKFSMAVENEFRETVSENDLLLLSKEKVSAVQVIYSLS